MGQIVKGMLGIFFLFLVAVTGFGTMMAQAETTAAQNYHTDVITELENSNFNAAVMNACKEQAAANGYTLTINPIEADHAQMAEVILTYPYRIGIFELSQEKQIRGYAE